MLEHNKDVKRWVLRFSISCISVGYTSQQGEAVRFCKKNLTTIMANKQCISFSLIHILIRGYGVVYSFYFIFNSNQGTVNVKAQDWIGFQEKNVVLILLIIIFFYKIMKKT